MKLLAQRFAYNGFSFTVIHRQGRIAVLEKVLIGGSQKFYEVVLVRIHPEQTFPSGVTHPERESMPPSEAWGTEGWSYTTLADAMNRVQSLSADQNALAGKGVVSEMAS